MNTFNHSIGSKISFYLGIIIINISIIIIQKNLIRILKK